MAGAIQAQKLLKASETSSKNLLREMMKIKGGKKGSNSLPGMVAGATGESLIVEEFRKMYEELYNSCDSSAEMEMLNRKLRNMISNNSMEEVNLVTGPAVKQAAVRLIPGKGGCDWKLYQ